MIIFVGDKPSPKMKPDARPFQGAVCEKRLYDWIGSLEPITFQIINQCDFSWAQLYAWTLTHADLKYVALGNNASKALKGIPHFKLPHPSARNRQINDMKFINQKILDCRKWLSRQE